MKTAFTRISFTVAACGDENLECALFELGCRGIQEPTALERIAFFLEPDATAATALLKGRDIPCTVELVENRDWESEWRKSMKPVKISDRFTVTPSWLKDDIPEADRIIIDPKMTFGSGHHETTRMCAMHLENCSKGAASLLDIGTGTTILALAGEKLGIRHIVALDNDPTIVDNLRENLVLNRSIYVRPFIGTLSALSDKSGPFDLITANIISSVILVLLPDIIRLMRLQTRLIVSGILVHEKAHLIDQFSKHGLTILTDANDKEWYSAVAARTA